MQEAFGGDSPILLLKNRNREHGNQCHIENLPYLQKRFPNLRQTIFEIDLNNVPDEADWPRFRRLLQKQLLTLDHIEQPHPKNWLTIRQLLNDKMMLQISGEGLKQAAENIKGVLPAAVGIATQIVTAVAKLAG